MNSPFGSDPGPAHIARMTGQVNLLDIIPFSENSVMAAEGSSKEGTKLKAGVWL